MPVTDLTGGGVDDAWPTRLPQGWVQFADGTIGPPNQAGSDWNAPYRGAPGAGSGASSGAGLPAIPDWLKQLMQAGGGGGGAGMPPGAPAAGGAPAAPGGPQIIPPQNSPIPPHKSVGPFTGGTSTEGSYYDPRSWFKANPGATFQQGQPMGPDVTGGGLPNPLALMARGNPYARAAIAAAGVTQPTATAADAAPTNMWDQRPSGVGGMPGPQATNTPQGYPHMPWPGSNAATYPHMPWPDTPTGSPSATPRPGATSSSSSSTPLPPSRPRAPVSVSAAPKSVGNKNFGLYQSQLPIQGGGPLSRNPIYTTLNLFGARS